MCYYVSRAENIRAGPDSAIRAQFAVKLELADIAATIRDRIAFRVEIMQTLIQSVQA